MPEIVITLDMGGSGVKASCFDPAGDVAPTAAVTPYPSADPRDEGTFDPTVWAETAITALAELVARCPAQPQHYLGITVSAIRIPFVLLDADQRVVGPSLLNRDRRALPIVGDLVSSVGHRKLHSTTGHWAAPEFGLPKLIWIQRAYPAAWQHVRTILQLHDWFIFSLCGAIASEASSAAMSQMMDVSTGTWAFDLLAAECGVRDEMMPEFAVAGTRAGGLLRTVAEQVGLPAGLPVHLGAGDTHMSALGAGSQASGCPIVVAGTTGPAQFSVKAAADLGAWFPLLVSALPAATGWALEANAGPTGEIVDRLHGLTELSGPSLQAALGVRGFTVDEAADCSEHLTVLAGNPFFGPDGWHVWPAPTVFGLTPRHTGADVLGAARFGTCLAFGQVLKQLSSAFEFRGDSVIAAGGMSRSAAWNQALADVTGRTVLVPDLDQVSGLAGAALVAGISVESVLHDLEPARYTPDAASYADLQRRAEDYCRLYTVGQARSRENQLTRNGVDVHAGPH
jgi:sugar (pentulose or hexulose) kinase